MQAPKPTHIEDLVKGDVKTAYAGAQDETARRLEQALIPQDGEITTDEVPDGRN